MLHKNKISQLLNQNRPTKLECSLKPFTFLLRVLIGVSLVESNSKWRRAMCYVHRCVMLASSLIGIGSVYGVFFYKKLTNQLKEEEEFAIGRLIDFGSAAVYFPAVHLSFFIICCTNNWSRLKLKLNQIQHELNLDVKFYKKCDRIVLMALGILLLVSLINELKLKNQLNWNSIVKRIWQLRLSTVSTKLG